MDYLAAMRAFVRAVDLGSFSKVAAESGAKVSTVSRYIAGLEADLGAALLNRSTRRLHLTEVGTAFYQRAVDIVAELDEARRSATALNSRPQGLLRLGLPAAFGRAQVLPAIGTFLARYPDIRLEVTLADGHPDLIENGIDVAVRIGALGDSGLVAKRIASHEMILCSSLPPRAQTISAPAELKSADCLGLIQPNSTLERWHFRSDPSNAVQSVEIAGRVRCNDLEGLRAAALSGLGYALLPRWLVSEELQKGSLRRALPAWEFSSSALFDQAIWTVYPPKKIVSPKVRSFIDFMQAQFGKAAPWQTTLKK